MSIFLKEYLTISFLFIISFMPSGRPIISELVLSVKKLNRDLSLLCNQFFLQVWLRFIETSTLLFTESIDSTEIILVVNEFLVDAVDTAVEISFRSISEDSF